MQCIADSINGNFYSINYCCLKCKKKCKDSRIEENYFNFYLVLDNFPIKDRQFITLKSESKEADSFAK